MSGKCKAKGGCGTEDCGDAASEYLERVSDLMLHFTANTIVCEQAKLRVLMQFAHICVTRHIVLKEKDEIDYVSVLDDLAIIACPKSIAAGVRKFIYYSVAQKAAGRKP